MNSGTLNFQKLWRPALIAAALAVLYANVLAKLGFDWWTDENYSHGLLVPFVIGFIVWLEFDELKRAVEKPSVLLGFLLISFAFLMLLGGTLGAELFTQRISLVLMLAGIVVYFFGAKTLKSLVAPFLLLLLAIPIPQIIFNKIAFPLQIQASQAAVWGIRLFELPTVRKGNVIELLPRGATQIVALEVVEACSGIRSLMTLVTLALVLAYFTRSKSEKIGRGRFAFLKNFDFWRTVILMFAAIPIAILTNAARVTATGVLTYYYGKQATEGTWHTVSGWLVYALALALLLGLNLIVKKFRRENAETSGETKITNYELRKAESPKSEDENSAYGDAQLADLKFKTRNLKPVFNLLLVALLIGGVFINWFGRRGEAEVFRKPLAEIPAVLGAWKQKGNEIRFDAQTESVLRASDYTMREYVLSGGRVANLYVGYYASQRTGASYHSPQNCLPGAGWTMQNPETVEIEFAPGKTFAANKFTVENGAYRAIMIYWYQGRGRRERNEYFDKIETVVDSIRRRRTDGAMVRVMTNDFGGGNSETDATKAAIDLAAQTVNQLTPFIPD
ncbi:MAG: EpsI family protein [Acidobacteria bacterium]|nr:EpsI family protein [Acidobacteriota bacterium]